MDLRKRMVLDVLENGYSISEAASKYDVSRPTVRLWLMRYQEGVEASLSDRSHAPASCPHKTLWEVEELVLAEKKRFPFFGAKKLRQRLIEDHPELGFPSVSSFDRILARHGMVKRRGRRRRTDAVSPFPRRYQASRPGELMTMDFKGQFRMKNGHYCYPLTIVDRVSHYILACKALSSTHLEPAWAVIVKVLREHGLPDAMQSDNGPPFGATNGQFSTMSVRLMKLGVLPVYSRPGRPQDNGSHERMHLDLKQETARIPANHLPTQQRLFDDFLYRFNHERPHESLGMNRPARVYRGSLRPFPSKTKPPEYPGYFEKRLVSSSGSFKWAAEPIFISSAFAGETLAFEPTDEATWAVYFGSFFIGKFNERERHFS